MMDWVYFNPTVETHCHTLTLTAGWDVFSLLLVAVPVSLRKHHQAHMQLRSHTGR